MNKEALYKELAARAVELITEGRMAESEEILAKIRKMKAVDGINLTKVGDPDCEACQ